MHARFCAFAALPSAAACFPPPALPSPPTTDRSTALHIAAAGGNAYRLLKVLLDKGAAVDALDSSGATPLHHAVRHRNMREVSALLKAGADPSIVDAQGELPESSLMGKDSTSVRIRADLKAAATNRARADTDSKGEL